MSRCAECNEELAAGAAFCDNCGKPVAAAEPVDDPAATKVLDPVGATAGGAGATTVVVPSRTLPPIPVTTVRPHRQPLYTPVPQVVATRPVLAGAPLMTFAFVVFVLAALVGFLVVWLA